MRIVKKSKNGTTVYEVRGGAGRVAAAALCGFACGFIAALATIHALASTGGL